MIFAERSTRRESVRRDLSELAASEDEFAVQPALGRSEQSGLLRALGQRLDPVAVPEHLLAPRGGEQGDAAPVMRDVPARLSTIVRLKDPQSPFAVGALH